MGDVSFFSLIFLSAGVLFITLGLPLFWCKVPPNAFYGCRTARSMSDPAVWYQVNRVTGRNMIRAGAVVIAASLLMMSFGQELNSDTAVIVLLSVMIVSVGAAFFGGLKAAR
jgi:uncharacterized membrane protein